jgi:hypothetical protein
VVGDHFPRKPQALTGFVEALFREVRIARPVADGGG